MNWWYVLQTKPGREHQAHHALSPYGARTALPRVMRWIRSSGNWYLQERLLFPAYLFVCLACPLDDTTYYRLTQPEDMLQLLGQGHEALPQYEAKYIEWLSNNGSPIQPTEVYTRFFGGKRRISRMSGFLEPVSNKVYQYDWHRRRAAFTIPLHGEMKELQMPITPWALEDCKEG